MPVYRDEAVVLRTHKLGEADRILTLLTRRHGKVRAVAKGVRRTGSKFGARLEPFMVADLQLYEGRTLDVVTQAESLGSYGAEITQDYGSYTAANAMVEAADKLTEAEGSLQQYLLLVGALRSLARREHGASLTLDSYLLRALALAGWAPSFQDCARCGKTGRAHRRGRAARRRGLRRVRPARHAPHRPVHRRACSARCSRATGRSPNAAAPVRPQPGERHRRRLHPVAPRARPALTAARLQRNDRHVTPKPYTHRDAVPYRPLDWTGVYPPDFPKGSVPNHVAIVMDGNGRWANRRGLTRIEGHKAGEVALLDVVAGAVQAGVKHLSVYAFSTENWKRSPEEVRFLMGYNRDVLHRRRDQLNEWGVRIRWAGRQPAPVGVRHQRAAVRRAADRGQRHADPHDVRQLRRPQRDHGCGALDRRRRGIRSHQAVGGLGEAHREAALRARAARRRPVRAQLGGAAHVELHAVAVGLRRDGVPRHAVARLLARRPVGGDRACTLAATAVSAARSTRRPPDARVGSRNTPAAASVRLHRE